MNKLMYIIGIEGEEKRVKDMAVCEIEHLLTKNRYFFQYTSSSSGFNFMRITKLFSAIL